MTTISPDYGLKLAQQLIRKASVTPADGGCMELICAELEPLGFVAEHLPFGEVNNLWLRLGDARPLFCFVGHTDVVPPGPAKAWRYPAFSGTLADGCLWGRGAADMKGGVAAMVAACKRFVAEDMATHKALPGSIALLLTSDEEGPAVDGTARVAAHLKQADRVPDWVLVGEPSCDSRIGDRIRVGRRGSLHCHIRIRGLQGHVAYPDRVKNPIHAAAPFIAALVAEDWSCDETDFPPTSLQCTQAHAGTGALNVVPGEYRLHCNLRYSPNLPVADIQQRVGQLAAQHMPASSGFTVQLDWLDAAQPFSSPPGGKLRQVACDAIQAQTGLIPECSTSGGTSDGRFMAPLGCEVVEFGHCVTTIHQVDEHIPVAHLATVEACYLEMLRRLFAAS